MPGLLVADDMAIVRSTVAQIVAREQLSLHPVTGACNGQEAVSLASQMQPDIVLMDVKMPGLNGLQAAAAIRSEHPATKVVMLTAHNEFFFAQQAIKLGAADYLLKPVRPAKLVATLLQVQAQIHQERQKSLEAEEAQNRLRQTLPMIEASLVKHLVFGLTLDRVLLADALKQLSKTISWPAVIVVDIDGFNSTGSDELRHLGGMLTAIVRQAVAKPARSLIGQSKPGRVVGIISTDDELTTVDQMRDLGHTIRRAVEVNTSVTVTVSLGRRYPDLESVPRSYAEVSLAKRRKADQGGNTVVHINDIDNLHTLNTGRNPTYPLQLERDLLDSVRLGQSQISLKLMTKMVDYLLGQPEKSSVVMHNHLVEIMALLSRAAIDAGAPVAEILDLSHRQVLDLSSLPGVAEIRSWAFNCLTELVAAIQAVQSKDVVQQAITYIHQNQHRSDISLKEVADVVNLSPSHLASLFKAKVGVSYMRYLTSLRLEQAKKLLRTTDLTIAAVAEAVGYQTLTNFYRLFQRETGMTPATYRQSH